MSKLHDNKWMLGFWVDLGNALQTRLDGGFCPGDLPLKPDGQLMLNRLNHYRHIEAGKPGEQPLIDLIRQFPSDAPRFLHPVVVALLKGETPAGQEMSSHGHPPDAGVLLMHAGSGWGGIPSVDPREGEAIWRLACGFSHNGGYGNMTLERWSNTGGKVKGECVMTFDYGLIFDIRRYGASSEYVNPRRRRDFNSENPTTWNL